MEHSRMSQDTPSCPSMASLNLPSHPNIPLDTPHYPFLSIKNPMCVHVCYITLVRYSCALMSFLLTTCPSWRLRASTKHPMATPRQSSGDRPPPSCTEGSSSSLTLHGAEGETQTLECLRVWYIQVESLIPSPSPAFCFIVYSM